MTARVALEQNSGAISVDRAELASLHRAMRAMADRLAALLEKPDPARWLSASQAAKRAHVASEQTVRNWCRRYEIGIRLRGVWQVDSILLEQFLRGRSRVTAP